jgi:hypothetical protein
MCRSIKVLRKPGEIATADEVRAAALQYVRKISGFHKPSKANQQAFEQAVFEITQSSSKLLASIRSKAGLMAAADETTPAWEERPL